MSGHVACGIEVRVASHMLGHADQALHAYHLQAALCLPGTLKGPVVTVIQIIK